MTAQNKPQIAFFNEIDKEDIPLVGGKAANLGEMTKADFPVPRGFAITVVSYDIFLDRNDLRGKIDKIIEQVDVDKPEQLQDASEKVQHAITRSEIPKDVSGEIIKAYKKLTRRFKSALVAVRSSATAEDLPGASFAGQQATFLNVKGNNNLLVAVRDCWASLFTGRAIFYRAQNKIDTSKVKISVIVQEMVPSEVSGVMFTINPVTNEKDRILIEAVWGLGEMIVQGSVVPDKYFVQKETFAILSKEISDQEIQLVKRGQKNKEIKVPKKLREKQ
jgi:pyruvate,water dikinase